MKIKILKHVLDKGDMPARRDDAEQSGARA
jgi:hypothetical protein